MVDNVTIDCYIVTDKRRYSRMKVKELIQLNMVDPESEIAHMSITIDVPENIPHIIQVNPDAIEGIESA